MRGKIKPLLQIQTSSIRQSIYNKTKQNSGKHRTYLQNNEAFPLKSGDKDAYWQDCQAGVGQ